MDISIGMFCGFLGDAASLIKFANQESDSLASIGIDTWGVDYGLLDRQGDLIGNPYHYRDSRTDEVIEEAFRRMPKRAFLKKPVSHFRNLIRCSNYCQWR